MELSSLTQNARTKKEKKKQYPETRIPIECLDIWQVCGQIRGRLSVHTSTKRFYRKEPEEPERTKNNTKRKAGNFWAVSSVGGTFWAVSSVGGTFWAASRFVVALLAVLRVDDTCWRYLELAVFFWRKRYNQTMAVFFSAVMHYGGNVLGGRRFFVFRR